VGKKIIAASLLFENTKSTFSILQVCLVDPVALLMNSRLLHRPEITSPCPTH